MTSHADPTNATTAVAERVSRIKDLLVTSVSNVTEPVRTRATMYRTDRNRDGLLRELGQLHVTAANAGIAADSAEIDQLIAEINAADDTNSEDTDR